MNTPIHDFICKYSTSNVSRFHMPGHKGRAFLGLESHDITEVYGADVLLDAEGIINQSEKNAAAIFGTGGTFYSTEGSTLCIKTMLYTLLLTSVQNSERKKIIAVRNVHKSFVYACAQLDLDVAWIFPENSDSVCAGAASDAQIERAIKDNPDALGVFLTSPNYLGQLTDIKAISKICRKAGIPLIVDNAHGAYLKFIGMHPIDLGADMCCDSAHKTLPVLTGGAYLHVSKEKKDLYAPLIKNAMSAFASTSPSYLIMESLDLCNKYLSENYTVKLNHTIKQVKSLKDKLISYGYKIIDGEPLKLTIITNGECLADILRNKGIECEYYDKTCMVIMISTENTVTEIEELENALISTDIPQPSIPMKFIGFNQVLSIRKAFLSPYKNIPVELADGCICANPCVSCPPAIPIVVSGEIITKECIKLLKFYGHKTINIIS